MQIRHYDERDLQRKIARKISSGDFTFQVCPSSYFCDIRDSLHGIFIEVKPKAGGYAQLLYGVYREFGSDGERNFTPQMLGVANDSEIQFFNVPEYGLLQEFARSIDPSLTLAPSSVPHNRNAEAQAILGTPFAINHYDEPLDFHSPYVFINERNVMYIMSRLERYDVDVRELILKIADVYINQGEIVLLRTGGISDNIDGSTVRAKRIRPEDESFVKALRVTPRSVEVLRAHFDEYDRIEDRRVLGKFYTKPELANRVHDIILQHVDPDFILEPYAGSGSLVTPFVDTPGIMNDISLEDIEIARMTFEGTAWRADNIDCINAFSAEELIDRWGLRDVWTERSVIFTNPPFGSSRSKKSPVHDDQHIAGMRVDPPENLKQYGRQDRMLPAIGQLIEVMKQLGTGYLAFFSPLGLFLGRRSYNACLSILLENFDFYSGLVIRGSEFNEVNSDKPIAFTIWKFGGRTQHLDIEFRIEGQTVKLGEGTFLKDVWNAYAEDCDGHNLLVRCSTAMNDPYPAIYSCPEYREGARMPGARVLPVNVTVEALSNGVPSEIIYSLWSTLVGQRAIVPTPLAFDNAYVHIPQDFRSPEMERILVYSLLWNIQVETVSNYTGGRIGFVGLHRILVFGNPEQSRAVRDLLDRYRDEPCMDETVGAVLEHLRTRNETGWADDRALRKDLRERLSKLLDDIGYWDHIVVKPVN